MKILSEKSWIIISVAGDEGVLGRSFCMHVGSDVGFGVAMLLLLIESMIKQQGINNNFLCSTTF